MKQRVSTISLKVLVLSLVSMSSALCAQGPSNCGENLDNLVVGSNLLGERGNPPWEVFNPDVTPMVQGFDVRVACEVAHRLCFKKLTFRNTRFNALLDEVASGENIDIAMSALSITNARKALKDVSFVKYNDNDNLGMLVRAEDVMLQDPATVLDVLNARGAGGAETQVTAVEGSRQLAILEASYPDIIRFPTTNVTFGSNSVIEGLAAPGPIALFTNGPTARELAEQINEGLNEPLVVALENVTANIPPAQVSDGFGIAINTECCQLYANIAQAIQDMENDGTLAALRKEFGVGTFTPQDLTPDECRDTESNINSNPTYNLTFSKFCPCDPEAVEVTA